MPEIIQMKKHTLSVLLITKNEADRVERCLLSVKDIADEIIILDSGSTDETVNICKRYTDNIEITDWPGFGKQKQRALAKANCDWVLSIDADEALDETMQQAILELLSQDYIEKSAYKLPWGVTLHGKTLRHGRSARCVLRLFERKGAEYSADEVHETVIPNSRSIGALEGYLLHYSHRNFKHGLNKAADYAWLGSLKYHRKGKKSGGLLLALLRSIWTFFLIYIIRRGFLDGGVGFIVAMTYAQVNFNKYVGLWLLEKRISGIEDKDKDKVINMLAVTHHIRKNINPIRPEASQIIGLHLSGKVKVTVLCNPNSTLIPFFEKHGIEVFTSSLKHKISLRSIWKIRQLIKDKNVDILHLFNNVACSNGATAAIGTNAKVIAYRGQTGNISRADPFSYLTLLHPRLNKIICVANAVTDDLKTHVWGDKNKAQTVYKGHDQSWYQNQPTDLDFLALPKDSFVMSLVANLRPRKGLHILMEAMALLPDDINIDLLLVGADPESEKVQALMKSSNKMSRIHALGYREDAPEIAASSDLTLLPTTKREGLCRAVLEANSYGVPAIVSDTGGNAELVKDDVTGIVVPPSNPQALADAILKLYNNRELCQQYGIAAKSRAINKFNVEQGVQATLNIYYKLLGVEQ